MKLATDGSYVILELGDRNLVLTQDQILSDHEKAEKWDKTQLRGFALDLNDNMILDTKSQEVVRENEKIIERLDKEIEICNKQECVRDAEVLQTLLNIKKVKK